MEHIKIEVEFDDALNDAAWAFLRAVPDALPFWFFNSLKSFLKKAIQTYLDHPDTQKALIALVTKAVDTAQTSASQESQKVVHEYYFRNNNCTAPDHDHPDCKCWYKEGTGPFADARRGVGSQWLGWRVRPNVVPTETGHQLRESTITDLQTEATRLDAVITLKTSEVSKLVEDLPEELLDELAKTFKRISAVRHAQ